MPFDQAFSAAQLFGYLAFLFGASAYLQKNDKRLKVLLSLDCICCVIHFWMLGNYPASVANVISMLRTATAIRWAPSWRAALFFTVLTIVSGAAVAQSWWSVFPIAGSSVATLAIFLLTGIRMRCTILLATILWLINNIHSGSIGGTMLELTIFTANSFTILRMLREKRRAAGTASEPSA